MKAVKLASLLILALILVACNGTGDEDTANEAPDQPAAESSAPETEPAEAPTEAPPTQPPAEPVGPPPEPQETTIEGAEGLPIEGTFYPGSGEGPRPGVLLLHQNRGNRDDWQPLVSQLTGNGFAVVGNLARSSGNSIKVAPVFSDWAILNALRTTSGITWGDNSREVYLLMGRNICSRSSTWCDSLCRRLVPA